MYIYIYIFIRYIYLYIHIGSTQERCSCWVSPPPSNSPKNCLKQSSPPLVETPIYYPHFNQHLGILGGHGPGFHGRCPPCLTTGSLGTSATTVKVCDVRGSVRPPRAPMRVHRLRCGQPGSVWLRGVGSLPRAYRSLRLG